MPHQGLTLDRRIRSDIEAKIYSGLWPPGSRLPFEVDLASTYGCSRMTVNKAMAALVAAGLIVRRRKAGTFVALPAGEQPLFVIHDLDQDAARLGTTHTHAILRRAIRLASKAETSKIEVSNAGQVLTLRCRHDFGGIPFALEQRRIYLDAVPAAAEENFIDIAPGTWLLQQVPWTKASHRISARNATMAVAKTLAVSPATACLILNRRTWHDGAVITDVEITYPGDRHSFSGSFSPGGIPFPSIS